MAGIGQSSTQSSDQSTPWNSQFTMGRPTNIDSHSMPNKYLPVSEKRRPIAEENGISPQNMYQYGRQPTGFQSSNDKSYLSNMLNPMPTGNSAMNYNMYQRAVGSESNIYPYGNLDISSESKPGLNASARLGVMSQFIDSSNHSYLSPTPHKTITNSVLNPNVPAFNGQAMSKNRPGSYDFDSHSLSHNQYETNWDNTEFPSLNIKPSNLLSQMSSSSNYNYNLSNKNSGQINYQVFTKSNMMMPGEHTSEFSIQQEDFPALPVAQNPVTCTEYQRSSSASGINVPVAVNSGDNSSQSHNSSIVDSRDFLVQKSYSSNCVLDYPVDQGPMMMPLKSQLSSSTSLLSSANNSSQFHNKLQKKISKGPNNYISNIPTGMVSDAFGLIGLVKLLGINDTYNNLNMLAPGLETLSVIRELDSSKDLYHSYDSPLRSNCAGRPQDMDFPVPKEYRIRHLIMDKLTEPLPDKLSDDTLFWIFYNLTGEECQLTAARILISRQWRFNKRDRIWLARDPNGTEFVTHSSFERGNYIVWDYENVKRVSKTLTIYYKDLLVVSELPRTKIQLPFCCMKRIPTNSIRMFPSGISMGTTLRDNKTIWTASYLQPHQNLAVVGGDICPVSLSGTGFTSTVAGSVVNNDSYSQQQQSNHNIMTIPSSSSLVSNTTTVTATSTIVTAIQL